MTDYRAPYMMYDAANKASDQEVVLVKIVLHAIYQLTHPQEVVGQACTPRTVISCTLKYQ